MQNAIELQLCNPVLERPGRCLIALAATSLMLSCGAQEPEAVWVTTLSDSCESEGKSLCLRRALATGQAADLPIRFSPDLRGRVVLNEPFVLRGPGRIVIEGDDRVTLDARGRHRHFDGLGPDLTLRNVALVGGHGGLEGGGAIRMGVGQLALMACQFSRNVSTGIEGGGAVFVDRSASLQVRDSFFRNNTAPRGGAIRTVSDRTAVIVSSRFINQQAGEGASVHHAGADLLIGSSWFENESAERGAIYLAGTRSRVDIEGSSFIENHAIEGAAVYAADASIDAPLRIRTGYLRSNQGTDGGSLVVRRHRPLVVEDVLFEENTTSAGPGAAIDTLSDLVVSRSEFLGNRAALGGGAIRLRAPAADAGLRLQDSRFVGNRAARGGAVEVLAGSSIDVRNSSFVANRSTGRGGALHVQLAAARRALLQSTTFIDNESAQPGSALCNDGAEVIIRGGFVERDGHEFCDPGLVRRR